MDQKLLESLNNIGLALESLVDALNDKKDTKSATATSIKSGNFGEQLKVISTEIKSIKSDTKEILKNQKTILSLSEESEKKKTESIEKSGTQEQIDKIKKGVGTIILIAGAVLAIGLAFKIVGKVDFLSVISLSLAITIIALSFEKISSLNISIGNAARTSVTLVMMSLALTTSSFILSVLIPVSAAKLLSAIAISAMFAALGDSISKIITSISNIGLGDLLKVSVFMPVILSSISLSIALSSYALSFIQPISLTQFLTATFISITFIAMSLSVRKLIKAFNGIDTNTIIMASSFIPLIMPAIALSIALSSYALQLITPVSISQFFSSLLISGLFFVMSMSVRKLIKAFDGVDTKTIIMASFFIPLIMPAIALSIALSSHALQLVTPIGNQQLLTSFLMSGLFVVLSFAIKNIISSFEGLSVGEIITASISIPILFVSLSGAIWASSMILSNLVEVSNEKMISAAIMGSTLALISLAMLPVFSVFEKSKVKISTLLKGGIAIVIIAGAIVASSHLLKLGEYSVYPGLDWILGVGLSLTTFGAGAVILGGFVAGPQALAFIAGIAAVIGVAGTIVAVSKILKKGEYDTPNMLEWAKSTTLLYTTFTPIIGILGTYALASAVVSVFGPNPWKLANSAMIDIAKTIVSVSVELKKGDYTGGPNKAWAKGVAIAIDAFAPVYGMLMKNSILKFLGGGGVGPEDFKKAISTVTDGIVEAANRFSVAKVSFNNPPSKDWAEGVGLAIGAFAPVYEVLYKNASWLSSGVSVEDMKNAISTISTGIIDASVIFSENKQSFDKSNYPSKDWGEGVGSAIGAFLPLFDALSDKSWFKSDDKVIGGITKGISAITTGIVNSAMSFSGKSFNFETGEWEEQKGFSNEIWSNYPPKSWSERVLSSIKSFFGLFDELDNRKYTLSSFNRKSKLLNRSISSMINIAKELSSNSKFFNVQIDSDFMKKIGSNMIDFKNLLNDLIASEDGGSSLSKFTDSVLGKDPISRIAKRMITLASGYDALAKSLTGLGLAMKTLNITDVRMLGGLTRELSGAPSSINIETKSSGDKINTSKPNTTSQINTLSSNKKGVVNNNDDFSDKLDEVIRILTNIEKSTVSVDSLISEYIGDVGPNSDSQIKPPGSD